MRIEICAECEYPIKEIGRTKVCIRCVVRASTSAQGLPEKIEDPVALADLARMLLA